MTLADLKTLSALHFINSANTHKEKFDLNAPDFITLKERKGIGAALIDAHRKVISSRLPIGVPTRYKPGFKGP